MLKIDLSTEDSRPECPTIYCGKDLSVLDLNDTAKKWYGHLANKNMGDYILPVDATEIKACIYYFDKAPGSGIRCFVPKLAGIRGARQALVILRRCFSTFICEFKLFHTREEMFREHSSRVFLMPLERMRLEKDLYPKTSNTDEAAEQLKRALNYDMLTHLYSFAYTGAIPPQRYDVARFLKRIITDISPKLGILSSRYYLNSCGLETNVLLGLTHEEFALLFTFLLYFIDRICAEKTLSVTLKKQEDGVAAVFLFKPIKTGTEIVHGMAFCLLSELYPFIKSYVEIVEYLCSIYDIKCRASYGEKKKLCIEFIMPCENESGIISVSAEEYSEIDYESWIKNAVSIINRMRGFSQGSESGF